MSRLDAVLDRMRAEFDAMPPADVAAMLPTALEAAREKIAVDEGLWVSGAEPMPFDEFCVALDGNGLYPRQRKCFDECGLMTAAGLVSRDRQIQELTLEYGKGCLSGSEHVTDRATGERHTLREWAQIGRAITLLTLGKDGRQYETLTDGPVSYIGSGPLLSVTLETGHACTVTSDHKFYGECGGSIHAWGLIAGLTRIQTASGFARVACVEAAGYGDYYSPEIPGTACYFDDNGVLQSNSGKDYTIAKFAAWFAFVILHLKGFPSEYFGLAKHSRMSFINIAPSKDLARTVFFEPYLSVFLKHDLFKPFRPNFLSAAVEFHRTLDGKTSSSGNAANTYIPIGLYSLHSSSASIDGYNPLCWVMDEADAFKDAALKSNADRVHNILRSSSNTRFRNLWLGFVISYPRVDEGFTDRIYQRSLKEMTEMGPMATLYADKAASWDVNLKISRNDPGIESDYRNDPVEARAKYECIPASQIDAFFEFPEKIAEAVQPGREPLAYVREVPLEMKNLNGKDAFYISAVTDRIVRNPAYTYFMGVDGGVTGDAYGVAVFHTEDAGDAIGYLCETCGLNPNIRYDGQYVQQQTFARVPMTSELYCGACYKTPEDDFGAVMGTDRAVRVDGWWFRHDHAAKGNAIADGQGNSFVIPHVYEDLIVRVKPSRATRPGEKNRIVHFEGMQNLLKQLIQELHIEQTRLDPYQTVQMTQHLMEATGADVSEILFTRPEQYRRARLVKAMLYASKITLLPDAGRDKEWRQLQRVNGNSINHPDGGEKDLWDAESVAIWAAATSKCNQLTTMWI